MPRSYFDSKCESAALLVPMFPPGRCILLRRLKGPRPPAAEASQALQQSGQQQRQRQQRGQRRQQHGKYSWDAVWVAPEQLTAEGILLSWHQASDHYTARLTAVLGEVASLGAAAQQQAADSCT